MLFKNLINTVVNSVITVKNSVTNTINKLMNIKDYSKFTSTSTATYTDEELTGWGIMTMDTTSLESKKLDTIEKEDNNTSKNVLIENLAEIIYTGYNNLSSREGVREQKLNNLEKKGFELKYSTDGYITNTGPFIGYQSDIFINDTTKTIVVSNPGTNTREYATLATDLLECVKYSIGYPNSPKLTQAKKLVDTHLLSVLSDHKDYDVIFTGHSLGACTSDIQATYLSELCESNFNLPKSIKSITYESPGTKSLIKNYLNNKDNMSLPVEFCSFKSQHKNFINSFANNPTSPSIIQTIDEFLNKDTSSLLTSIKKFFMCSEEHSITKFLKLPKDSFMSSTGTLHTSEEINLKKNISHVYIQKNDTTVPMTQEVYDLLLNFFGKDLANSRVFGTSGTISDIDDTDINDINLYIDGLHPEDDVHVLWEESIFVDNHGIHG